MIANGLGLQPQSEFELQTRYYVCSRADKDVDRVVGVVGTGCRQG